MSARTPASYHPRHLISVLIPVRNGGDELVRCLDAINSQRIDEEYEVVIMDSGSTDGSVEVGRSRGARVHEIPASEFHHGRTRNELIGFARGEVIVWTSHDAYPDSDLWLERLTARLRDGQGDVG